MLDAAPLTSKFQAMRPLRAWFFGLIFCCFEAAGQQSVPVFRSPKDSADYAAIQTDLSGTRNLIITSEGSRRDSLLRAENALIVAQMTMMSAGAYRLRTVYQSSPGMNSYDDLVRHAVDEKIKTLSISGRNRVTLPDSLFRCKSLEELELVNWKLRRLPRKLNKLENLKELTILNNQPSSRLRLARNRTIKELTIRGDDGNGRLPARYRKFRSLELLDISRNNISAVPDLNGCRKIKTLQAPFNELTLDDLHGRQPKSLTDINLSNNKIKSVPDAISSFRNAKKLNFNNNQIEIVTEQIGALHRLEELSFYKNKLKDIPESIYALPNLKVIDLYFNAIEKADLRLGQMQSLEVLYLANNRIYSLPDNLGQLPHLRELYLHNNRISNLPSSVRGLRQLTVLRINNNSILEFPAFLFELEKLQNLDFSHNQITTLDLEHFNYTQLKILALVGNPWDSATRDALPAFAERLRTTYKTVVHLNTYTEEVE